MLLSKALSEANAYWQSTTSGASADIMGIRAKICVEILGEKEHGNKLTAKDAAKLLKGLADRGLARKTVADYYSTFKRMLTLNDDLPPGHARWPKPPTAPRKCRVPIGARDYKRVVARLHERNFGETADLAILLNAVGGRVQREVLLEGNLRYRTLGGVLVIFITGKGGHEREVPIACPFAGEILKDRARYRAVLAVPYKTHLWRWNTICEELGIKGLATFHHIRHKYATEALGKTKNLRLVQELLGHSNPATTAIYTHVSVGDKVKALTDAAPAATTE